MDVTRCAALCDEASALELLRRGHVGGRERGTGYTALHYGCQYGLEQLVRALLEASVEVNAQSKDLLLQGKVVEVGGQTPLHLAARAGDLEVVQALLDARADVEIKDFDGFTAAEKVKSRGRECRRHACFTALKGFGHRRLRVVSGVLKGWTKLFRGLKARLLACSTPLEELRAREEAAKEAQKLRAREMLEVPDHLPLGALHRRWNYMHYSASDHMHCIVSKACKMDVACI